MKSYLKLLLVIALAVGVAGYFAAASSTRDKMERELSASLGRSVKVKSASFILPPAVKLQGVEVPAADGSSWSLHGATLVLRSGGRPRERQFELSGRLGHTDYPDLGAVNAVGTCIKDGGPIDATVRWTGADLPKLAPYLQPVLGVAPVRGTADVETQLTLHQGIVMAHNSVTATGVAFAGAEPTTLGPDGNRLIELLRDKEGKIHLSFIVTGKLGEKLDWSDLTTGAMREAMRQAMSRSILQVMSDTEQNRPVEERMRRKLDTLDR